MEYAKRAVNTGVCVVCNGNATFSIEGIFDPYCVCRRCDKFAAKESRRLSRAIKRATLKKAIADIKMSEWIVTLRFFKFSCAYCGKDGNITLEHIKPLAEMGATTWGNVVPVCRQCNRLKMDKDITQVYKSFPIERIIRIAEFQVAIINALREVAA